MNCSSCQNQLMEYISGKLSEQDSQSLRTHLESCSDCFAKYASMLLTEKTIASDKQSSSNPFLATRVMAEIEKSSLPEYKYSMGKLKALWQFTSVAASILIAITFGVLAGNQISPNQNSNEIPEELAYLNDASMESLNLFVNE